MKKSYFAALCLTALLVLPGCTDSGAASHRQNAPSAVQTVLDSAVAASAVGGEAENVSGAENDAVDTASGAETDAVTPEEEEFDASLAYNPEEGIDIDLTRLNSTMVFSEVNRMVYEPEEFLGKTVRMSGQFALAFGYDEDGEVNPEQVYFACVIPDALACCSSGIEFERAGEYQYPGDYPDEGDDITVTGVFEMYEEYGLEYFHLADAVMEA